MLAHENDKLKALDTRDKEEKMLLNELLECIKNNSNIEMTNTNELIEIVKKSRRAHLKLYKWVEKGRKWDRAGFPTKKDNILYAEAVIGDEFSSHRSSNQF